MTPQGIRMTLDTLVGAANHYRAGAGTGEPVRNGCAAPDGQLSENAIRRRADPLGKPDARLARHRRQSQKYRSCLVFGSVARGEDVRTAISISPRW